MNKRYTKNISREKHKTHKNLKKHAILRARQRFSFERFNKHTYTDACDCIEEQRKIRTCRPIKHIRKVSNIRSIWLISIEETEVIAIWDKKRKAIATFMPKDWLR